MLTFGISDVLPELPGLPERWGKTALHCPHCHGFEYAGGRLGVLQTGPMSAHQAMLIADWGPTTLYLNGGEAPDEEARAKLSRRGVTIEPARILKLRGEDLALSSLLLEDGREAAIDALYLAPRSRLNSPIAEQLGCALDDGPFGPIIRTDADKLTSVRVCTPPATSRERSTMRPGGGRRRNRGRLAPPVAGVRAPGGLNQRTIS